MTGIRFLVLWMRSSKGLAVVVMTEKVLLTSPVV
jgi:hypothetical protein